MASSETRHNVRRLAITKSYFLQSKKTKKIVTKRPSSVVEQEKDDDLIALENSIAESVGLKVTVEDSADGGKVTLFFSSLSELDIILQKLS